MVCLRRKLYLRGDCGARDGGDDYAQSEIRKWKIGRKEREACPFDRKTHPKKPRVGHPPFLCGVASHEVRRQERADLEIGVPGSRFFDGGWGEC